MSDSLDALYSAHLATLIERATRALAAGGFDHLLIAAGRLRYRFLDDTPYAFVANPHFKHWLPLTAHPDCWIAFTPGRKPVLVYCQPDDYWHEAPAAPAGYWLPHFDLRLIREPAEARAELPRDGRLAIIGEPDSALADLLPNNPDAVLNPLHYARAQKTPYELALLRAASLCAARAHRAAEQLFRDGASELDIHRAYCAASGHTETELPYGNIVALNQHAAILHYQHQRSERPAQSRSFLIDAGAQVHGYAADITRTYAADAGEFAELIGSLDRMQQNLCAMVQPGQAYPDIHLASHAGIAAILSEHDLVRMDAQSMVESGVTSSFFPHGVGHLLGLQVHDIGGFMASASGGVLDKPAGHPYLRLTRKLEADFVVTIEPGLYFIDSLLARLREGRHASAVNWDKVDRLRPCGGIRIEDDVRATADQAENLTRDAFAAA